MSGKKRGKCSIAAGFGVKICCGEINCSAFCEVALSQPRTGLRVAPRNDRCWGDVA